MDPFQRTPLPRRNIFYPQSLRWQSPRPSTSRRPETLAKPRPQCELVTISRNESPPPSYDEVMGKTWVFRQPVQRISTFIDHRNVELPFFYLNPRYPPVLQPPEDCATSCRQLGFVVMIFSFCVGLYFFFRLGFPIED